MTNQFSDFKSVVALCGGVGGARLCHGLSQILDPKQLTAVVNTADDFEHWGLWICPDLDTVMYTLAGRSHVEQGWGRADESFRTMEAMKELGGESWFQLGDKDLATHLFRTQKLRRKQRLTHITQELRSALGVANEILPMCDNPCQTKVLTHSGERLDFQRWFVGMQAKPKLSHVSFEGETVASDEVLRALENADLVILTPSNPYVSIDPIISRDGVRSILSSKTVIGVSPIVNGKAIKGPLGTMIPALTGRPASARVVLNHYRDFLNGFVVENGDEVGLDGTAILPTKTIMEDDDGRKRLATDIMAFASELR